MFMSSATNQLSSHFQEEEDIARPHLVPFDDEHTQHGLRKGKGRQVPMPTSPGTSSEHLDTYPPISEDADETRRVEENLRRWEIAERQRRKAARGSSQSSVTPSLVTDVSRRASLLWSGRKAKHPSLGGLGTHTALQSQDNIDIVPLTHINNSPTPSPTHSDFDDTHPSDPFANPADSLSPFSDSHMSEMTTPPDTQTASSTLEPTSPRTSGHTLHPPPPPPQPLNLPPPRTPPPIIDPASPLSSSSPTFADSNKGQEEVRWWHDWLCGCGEGPDRGGDYQAGRTNPFE
ncbi:hypothetical protein BDZ97DRAFT_1901072 [Flammula alnicola]|nr:hypothetical protein BDZ97DRAFT_1901072 [Flammula alnicola]